MKATLKITVITAMLLGTYFGAHALQESSEKEIKLCRKMYDARLLRGGVAHEETGHCKACATLAAKNKVGIKPVWTVKR